MPDMAGYEKANRSGHGYAEAFFMGDSTFQHKINHLSGKFNMQTMQSLVHLGMRFQKIFVKNSVVAQVSGRSGAACCIVNFDFMIEFLFQILDFLPDEVIFPELGLEKAFGDTELFLNPSGRQVVEIGRLVLALGEIVRLDQPLFNQSVQTVIDLAQADP